MENTLTIEIAPKDQLNLLDDSISIYCYTYINNEKVILGKLVGTIEFKEFHEDEDYYNFLPDTFGYIQDLRVNKNNLRQNIGSKLIHTFKQFCKDFNIEVILLNASPDRSIISIDDLLVFYEKNGFENILSYNKSNGDIINAIMYSQF